MIFIYITLVATYGTFPIFILVSECIYNLLRREYQAAFRTVRSFGKSRSGTGCRNCFIDYSHMCMWFGGRGLNRIRNRCLSTKQTGSCYRDSCCTDSGVVFITNRVVLIFGQGSTMHGHSDFWFLWLAGIDVRLFGQSDFGLCNVNTAVFTDTKSIGFL